MGKRLDAAITNLQDFVLDRIGGVMTELEVADLTGRITLLVNESRFPFEMELIDLRHGVVVTIPVQISYEEARSIKDLFVKEIKKEIGTKIPIFICRGDFKIAEFHADLLLAARRFVEQCYACRGVGEVNGKNCGVCCDIRAALSIFDKHNIPQSRKKDTLPSTVEFQNGDPVLYDKKQAVFDTYLKGVSHGDDRGWHYEETVEPQSLARIRFGDAVVSVGTVPSGTDLSVVPVEKLQPWVHSSRSMPTEPESNA